MTDKEKKLLSLLIDAIDYCYLSTDGTYNNLALPVQDKVRYLKKEMRSPTEPAIEDYGLAYDVEVWKWLKEHGSEETMQVIMMTARHFCEWQKQQMMEEPATEDLEREVIRYKVSFQNETEYLFEETLDAIARHFAEWQYQKDRLKFSELKTKLWQEGFDAGAEAKEKQMMENAIDGRLGFVSIILDKPNFDETEEGTRVKVIIIKEEITL